MLTCLFSSSMWSCSPLQPWLVGAFDCMRPRPHGMRHGLCKDMLSPAALCESRPGSASDCRRKRVTSEVGMLSTGSLNQEEHGNRDHGSRSLGKRTII
jgi:hypothetical protein